VANRKQSPLNPSNNCKEGQGILKFLILDSVGVGAVFALRDTFFSAQKFIRMFQLM
jgi:hypothetical protein